MTYDPISAVMLRSVPRVPVSTKRDKPRHEIPYARFYCVSKGAAADQAEVFR